MIIIDWYIFIYFFVLFWGPHFSLHSFSLSLFLPLILFFFIIIIIVVVINPRAASIFQLSKMTSILASHPPSLLPGISDSFNRHKEGPDCRILCFRYSISDPLVRTRLSSGRTQRRFSGGYWTICCGKLSDGIEDDDDDSDGGGNREDSEESGISRVSWVSPSLFLIFSFTCCITLIGLLSFWWDLSGCIYIPVTKV